MRKRNAKGSESKKRERIKRKEEVRGRRMCNGGSSGTMEKSRRKKELH